MKKYAGVLFVLLTYLVTWSVKIPMALGKHGYTMINIPRWADTICTLSPGLIAIILTGILLKKDGLKFLFKGVVNWKVKFKWYVIVILLGTTLCGLSLVIFNSIYSQTNAPDEAYNFIFYFIIILPLSALWEEIGWRGFLLPTLQEKYTALKASLVIGFVWGLWHFPIYLARNPYGDQTITYSLVMFVGCFALSIILTWLSNSTKGSLLICILFHNTINTSAAYFYGNLESAEFRPLIIWVILLTLAAVGIGFKTKWSLVEISNPDINTSPNQSKG